MTPLAKMIIEQRMMPLKKRWFEDNGNILRLMEDIHCFECSEAVTMVGELFDASREVARHNKERFIESFIQMKDKTFLPAPRTWIEFEQPVAPTEYHLPTRKIRVGWLLLENGNVAVARGAIYASGGRFASWTGSAILPLMNSNENDGVPDWSGLEKDIAHCSGSLYYYLAIINTPRIVNRHQHMPSRVFERKLVSKLGVQGKFPLHAWTEIKLEITPPIDLGREEPYEAHLTGKKALHFVRQHLRVRLGQLELVKAHWRGDASIGIKRSRYALTNPPHAHH